mgnify:CR=1 FL=1
MIKEAYAEVNFSNPAVNPVAQFSNLSKVLNQVLPTIMVVASLVCLALLLMGAFSYVTSSGEQEKVQKARKTITYSIIGLVLIFLSYLMVRVISFVTGIPLLI